MGGNETPYETNQILNSTCSGQRWYKADMLRGVALAALLVDVGLVVGRLLTYPALFSMPGLGESVTFLGLAVGAAAAFVLWALRTNVITASLGSATATGVLGGVALAVHMAMENFGAHTGEDARLTLAVMLATFALWLSSGWRATTRGQWTLWVGIVAGCWTALVSIFIMVTVGFIGSYFDVPSAEYVATWPEYVHSGSHDPRAFAIANTLDDATAHIAVALILGSILGAVGGFIASLSEKAKLKRGG